MIRLERVSKRYPGGQVAVRELTIEFHTGQLTMLVGPSGCGKTTTLKMINRLIEPTEGRIFHDEHDVTHVDPVALRLVMGYVIQNVGLFPHLSIADNVATVPRLLGWDNPAFFSSPWLARSSIMAMDAWVSIPFVMILLLAGLQALPHEVAEAAKVDGASPWQTFWKITFPLMLPVSLTAVILRIIFELKLADIVINVTAGGPGGATDTVSSFIYREYRDRSNVGYGTMLAEFYLVIIIVFVTGLLALANRWMRRFT